MGKPHTTIGAEHFDFRVRKGIGWFPLAIAARKTGWEWLPRNTNGVTPGTPGLHYCADGVGEFSVQQFQAGLETLDECLALHLRCFVGERNIGRAIFKQNSKNLFSLAPILQCFGRKRSGSLLADNAFVNCESTR